MKTIGNFASGNGVSGLISIANFLKDLKYPICPGTVPDFSNSEPLEEEDESNEEEEYNEQDLADLEGLPDEPTTNHDPIESMTVHESGEDELLLGTI